MGTAPVLHHAEAEASSTRTGPVGSRSFIPASLHRLWANFLTSSRQRCYRFAVRFTLLDRCVLRPASLRLVSSRRVRSPTRLGPIGLLICMTLTGLLLPLPGALSTDTGSPESGARSLSHLVYEYLGTEDPGRASLLLADILRDPRADLDAVGMMIKEGHPYGMEPIGVQPGLPVRVRDHDYQYGLFVPPSYRPTKEYALVVCLHGAGFTGVYREHDRVHSLAGGHFFPREELPDLVAWFGSRRRDPVPARVTVVRDAAHLMAFAWVRIDATDRIAAFTERLIDRQDEAIVNRVYAKLDAEVMAPNRIEVRTRLVRRYTVFLNQRLVDLAKPVTIVTDGHVSYEGLVVPTVETLLRGARLRQDRGMLFPVMLTISVERGS